MPSRGICSLRRHRLPQPALLRLDSRLDGHLSAHLWHGERREPGFPSTFRRKEGTMKHLRAVNKKARRIDDLVAAAAEDVVALQNQNAAQRPHVPMGCALAFSPGWE